MSTDRKVSSSILAGALMCVTSAARAADEPMADHDMEDMRWGVTAFALSEVLELGTSGGDELPIRYDLVGWVGGAVNRVWAKADGEQDAREREGGTQLQLLYGRLISPYWDVQAGLRLDVVYGQGDAAVRPLVAVGLQGLAPGWFELEPTAFVSFEGDVSANLTASYDMFITQRLVLQPRIEVGAAVQEVPEFGVGSGLTNVESALRLRYEFWREFAPYVGVAWDRAFGETRELARAASAGSLDEWLVVAGLRVWR